QVERGRLQLEVVLDHRGRGGEQGVGRVGRHDDHVDAVQRVLTMPVHEVLDGAVREVGGELVLTGDVTTLDAGAAGDPLVGRVHHPLEVLVGDDVRGRVRPERGDARADPVFTHGSPIHDATAAQGTRR